jgi:hypothetical protein
MADETDLGAGGIEHVNAEHRTPTAGTPTQNSTVNTAGTPRTEVPQPGPGPVPSEPYPPSES